MRKAYLLMMMLLCTTWSLAQVRVQGVPRQNVKAAQAEATSTGAKVDFNQIAYWVGDGRKKAALVIKFNDGSNKAYVWGYKWNGDASGEDMFRAVAQDDPRLMLMTQRTNYNGTVCGIGYYPDGRATANVTFDLDGAMQDSRINFRYLDSQPEASTSLGQTSRPGSSTEALAKDAIEQGKATGIIQHPFDHAHYGYSAYDYDYWKSASGELWRAAWYDGYWSYWTTDDATKDYTYSGLGFSNRTLEKGSVDGWSYVSDMKNWYSADMNGATLEYVQPLTTAQPALDILASKAAVKRKSDTKTWTVQNTDELISAVEKASEGDIVQFDPSLRGQVLTNTLDEDFTIEQSLTIIGSGVILDGGDGGFFVLGSKDSAPTLHICDFVFRNNPATPVYLQGASGVVENCVFEDCDDMAAITIETITKQQSPTSLSVSNCRFSGNKVSSAMDKGACIQASTTPIQADGFVSATVVSSTFTGNSGKVASVMGIVNNAHMQLTNNVFESNTCTQEGGVTLYLPETFTREAICSRGYNVFNGTTTASDVNIWEATDAVGTDLAQALTLKDGEYLVAKGGPAYKHLPAGTTIEGITLPAIDILGNTIDYTQDTHSGACQKVDGEEEKPQSDYSHGIFFVNEDWYGHQNSTVNFLTDEGEWIYRVVQKENPGVELGCTNQYGQIYGDKFYLVAKQEKDPGASITGGRFTVCDAKTMKVIAQLPYIAQNEAGKSIADGRGCVGVDENKVYVSTSNGIYVFDTNTLQFTSKINGSDNPFADPDNTGENMNPSNPSLYQGQVGSMVRVDDNVFAVHQSAGVLVIDAETDKVKTVINFASLVDEMNKHLAADAQIDPENALTLPYPGSAITMAKDGSVWVPVAKGSSGQGATYPFLVRIDPHSLATSVVYIDPADGICPPANSWYAWTPDGFCASNVENVLYWNGGPNSWFSNYMIFKYDIETGTTTKIIDLDTQDDEQWKLYGCSMRPHPVSGDLYMSLFHQFGDPTYITRKTDKDGKTIADYSMINNYWFPSLPVFPDNEAPVVNAPAPVTFTAGTPVSVSLQDIATDADNFDAAIVKKVKAISNTDVIDAVCQNGNLIITPKAHGTADITIGINSNGKLDECTLTVTVPEDIAIGISEAQARQDAVEGIYTTSGVRVGSMTKGVNIVRTKNGASKKVLVK